MEPMKSLIRLLEDERIEQSLVLKIPTIETGRMTMWLEHRLALSLNHWRYHYEITIYTDERVSRSIPRPGYDGLSVLASESSSCICRRSVPEPMAV